MPRTRSLETYPNQAFWALVQRIVAERTFLIPCTQAQAASMRGEIYAWRRACEAAPEAAARLGIDTGQLRLTAFRIGAEGMTGMLAADLQTPSLIASALGGLPQQRTAAQQALDRLREAGLVAEGGASWKAGHGG